MSNLSKTEIEAMAEEIRKHLNSVGYDLSPDTEGLISQVIRVEMYEKGVGDELSPGAKPTVPCDAPLYGGKAMEQEAALKEQLRLCLDMILKGSYETFEKILRDEVVSVSRIKEAFSAYFDVKETPTNF